MRTRRTLDVSHLPDIAFGQRDPLWWGVMGLIAIESTVFALAFASYFYIRGNYPHFPPTAMAHYSKVLAAVNVVLLLSSVLPMHLANKAAKKGHLRGMRWGLGIATVMGLAFLAIRITEFLWIGFRWDTHAYGSVFWTIVGLHTTHTISSTLENLVLLALLFIGPVEEKHQVDVTVNGVYWFFVVASWVPTYAVLFLDPAVLGS
jgi:heme/copper-type cytochrome/quinol oxidase subunit 3